MNGTTGRSKNEIVGANTLLSALDAVTQGRAFVTLATTFLLFAVAVAVLGGISAYLTMKSGVMGSLMGLVSALIGAGILLVGITATGMLLSDTVWNRPVRQIGEAVLTALFTSHRVVLIVLVAALVFLAWLILLGVVLFICKLPGLGPLLYAFVFPLGAVLTGIVAFTLGGVMLPLSAPSVWNGATVSQSLAMLREVARTRLLQIVVMNLLLTLLMVVVSGIVSSILFSGVSIMTGLSVAIVGPGGNVGISEVMSGLMSGMMGSSGSESGYAIALGFGMAVLFLLGTVPVLLTYMKGVAIIHQSAIDGLSLTEAEADLRQRFDAAKQRAQDARDRALMPMAAPAMAPTATTTPQAACPACSAALDGAEMFCGECGHKLK